MSTDTPLALRLADELTAAVQTYPQTSEDEPGGYCQPEDRLMDDAASELRRLAEVERERDALQADLDKARTECLTNFGRAKEWAAKAGEFEAERDELQVQLKAVQEVRPVAWYVQRVAPGYRDDRKRLGPFWSPDVAKEWCDDRHVLRALVDASAIDAAMGGKEQA